MWAKDTPYCKYIEKEFEFQNFDGPFLMLNGTDFRYYPFGQVYEDFTQTKEFSRLNDIKQLGLIGSSVINVCQNQTRLFHSYVSGIMMDIVLTNNNIEDNEKALGIVAGLYHDLAIPPYSDQGKLISPGNYEEETIIEHLINKSTEIKENLSKYDIPIKLLVDTIQGDGKIGELINSKRGLDIDNLSYLAIDHVWICNKNYFKQGKLLEKKDIFDQYRNISFIENKWVFNKPEALVKLLKFRALMYKKVYNNPFNRAKESFLKRTLNDHHIDLDEILEWGDSRFEDWFQKKFGYNEFRAFFHIGKHPFREIKRIYDLDRLDELKLKKNKENIIVEKLKSPRDATENFVLHKNQVKLIEEIPEFKEEIEEIRKIIKELDYIGIYEKATAEMGFDFSFSDG